MTVRRAMEDLHREGWIERRHGRGTFVGPRAAMPISPPNSPSTARVAKLMVLVSSLGHDRHYWFSGPVLNGIDEMAADLGLSIELIGDQSQDSRAASRRLMQSRPDLLACVLLRPRTSLVLAEAHRLEIPCVLAAERQPAMGMPNIYEDSAQGTLLAVKHLAEQGHRRIGFMQVTGQSFWTFDRREAFFRAMEHAGLEAEENLVFWMPAEHGYSGAPPLSVDQIQQYLDRQNPTAVVCGCCWPLVQLGPLVRSGKIRVPQDLSIVTFDQNPEVVEWLGGIKPTAIAQPLREMGHLLARMARQVVEHDPLPMETILPCTLVPGDSVRAINKGTN